MSEARAWETSARPERMLELHPPRCDRKGRLLLAACCRMCWGLLPDARSRHAIDTAERWADELSEDSERLEAALGAEEAAVIANARYEEVNGELHTEMWRLTHGGPVPGRIAALHDDADHQNRERIATLVAHTTVITAPLPTDFRRAVRLPDSPVAVAILRDIFGNPFQPVAFSPDWRTDTAIALASQMYESREFSAMPILADALQDAGCDNTDILSHCRDANQPHVRGCWVVDLVLGKT